MYVHTYNSYNTGKSALPGIYAQSVDVRIRQNVNACITTNRVCYTSVMMLI